MNHYQSVAYPLSRVSIGVLLLNTLLPLFSFFVYATSKNSPIILWVLLGVLVAPNLLALKNSRFLNLSYWGVLLALLFVTTITSMDLWHSLLNNTTPQLAKHLLILLCSLVLAANLQMHDVQFKPPLEGLSQAEQISELFRGPPITIGLIIALMLCNLILVIFSLNDNEIIKMITTKLLQRGIIPPLTLVLFLWGGYLMVGKFILGNTTYRRQKLHQLAENARNKNTYFDLCWQQFENFYVIPKYINWAIPILGFIGTVLGISLATESLAGLLETSESDFSQLLSQALSPLGIAFDTTLIALTLSVILMLLQTLVYRSEEKALMLLEQQLHQDMQEESPQEQQVPQKESLAEYSH